METPKLLLKSIKQAINDEAVGESIYKKAAQDAKDPSVRKFFQKMAAEEKTHITYLKRLYQYMDKETDIHELVKDIRYNFNPSKEIFTKDFLDDIKMQSSLLLALNKSAKLEKNAVKFYEDCQNMAKDEQTKDFFGAMVTWENSHLNQILDIFENFDDDEIAYKQDDF